MKKIFIFCLMLVMMTTALLAIPSSAAYTEFDITKKCNCSAAFSGDYSSGIESSKMAATSIQITHKCTNRTTNASLTCWVYPTEGNYNNYTERKYSDIGSSYGIANHSEAYIDADFRNTDYSVRGTEATVTATTTCSGTVYSYRYFDSDGDVPLSVDPPVVIQ